MILSLVCHFVTELCLIFLDVQMFVLLLQFLFYGI